MPTDTDWDRIADIYDSFVQTSFDIPFFLNEARRSAGPVLELMAGTGRVSLPLIEAGVALTCVEGSAEMVARLRRKLAQQGLSAETHHADVRTMELGQSYPLILLPFHSFSEILNQDERRELLVRIYNHLSPGGQFICTLHNPPIRLQQATGQLQLAARQQLPGGGALLFWLLQQYDPASRLLTVLEFFEQYDQIGRMQEKRFLEVRSVIIERAEFEMMAQQSGFTVQALYGDYEYRPFVEDRSPFMVWVLERQ